MPTVSRIAAEGTTFSNATTTAPWTAPSHASLFSGQYTSDHGTHGGHRQFDPDVLSLASRLSRQDYRTMALSGNVWISPEFGFDAGFDRFSMKWDLFWDGADLSRASTADGPRARIQGLLSEVSMSTAPKTLANALYAKFLTNRYDDGAWLTTRRATRWIRQHDPSERPWFFFLNYLEPHLRYDPPTGYREKFVPPGTDLARLDEIDQDPWRYLLGDTDITDEEFDALRGLYMGELNYLDTQIARLYGALSAAGVLDETVLIIASDHGENIGDHGFMDHQYCLYDTLVHVPLIVRYPPAFDMGATVDSMVEMRDLYPTLLELAGDTAEEVSENVSHNSLVPTDGIHSTRDHAISEYITPQPSMDALDAQVGPLPARIREHDRALRSIRTADWKFIEGTDGRTELYDIARDPDETTNVAAAHSDVVEELSDELERERGSLERDTRRSDSISDRNRQRLEDLGYLQ